MASQNAAIFEADVENPPLPPRPAHQAPQFAPPPTQPEAEPASASSLLINFRERFYQLGVKVGGPINKFTNKLGSEAFWPSSLDLECDKAARILTSFCHDGFYTGAAPATPSASATSSPSASPAPEAAGPKGKPAKTYVKVPPEAIRDAAGLAIFTTFRTGLHISGASGSGIVVARLPDGGWSPPSGFIVHTLGAGLLVGLDIYDCVCVLRTPAAVAAFTQPRVSLGGEIGLVAGPVGAGGSVEAAVLARSASTTPVWSYMKSRGFYAGVQADGTVIIGRPDANGEFYGRKGISVEQILKGRVPLPQGDKPWTLGTRNLMEALKAAEGRTDVDSAVLESVSSGPTPGDLGMNEREKEAAVAAGASTTTPPAAAAATTEKA
ncbi:hypothetical protein F503_04190 [Ophiostoma piceae UAMH 11346]|uniref:Ysc84 actin-binding domain-containing protein n=1 Tax=Ophiostoma piceae (strain UAMH 11346) TaxID=1262450 RepID=S3CPU7_OPHP1|nr:hypothetical protein F503_04190 [Ophiostoma piceae UAMH 11346]